MPKIGSEVTTPDGVATVISNNMLKMLVKTKTTMKDGSTIYGEYKLDDISSSGYVVDTWEAVLWMLLNINSYKQFHKILYLNFFVRLFFPRYV